MAVKVIWKTCSRILTCGVNLPHYQSLLLTSGTLKIINWAGIISFLKVLTTIHCSIDKERNTSQMQTWYLYLLVCAAIIAKCNNRLPTFKWQCSRYNCSLSHNTLCMTHLTRNNIKYDYQSVLQHCIVLMELNFSWLVPRTTNSAWRYSTDFRTACRFYSYIHLSEWLHNVRTAGKTLQVYCVLVYTGYVMVKRMYGLPTLLPGHFERAVYSFSSLQCPLLFYWHTKGLAWFCLTIHVTLPLILTISWLHSNPKDGHRMILHIFHNNLAEYPVL